VSESLHAAGPRTAQYHGRCVRPNLRPGPRRRRAWTCRGRRPRHLLRARDDGLSTARPARARQLHRGKPRPAEPGGRSHRRCARGDRRLCHAEPRGRRQTGLQQRGAVSSRGRGGAAPQDAAPDLRRVRRRPLLRAGLAGRARGVQGGAPRPHRVRGALERSRLLAEAALRTRPGDRARRAGGGPDRQHLVESFHARQGPAAPRDDRARDCEDEAALRVREPGRRQRRAGVRRPLPAVRSRRHARRPRPGVRGGLPRPHRGDRLRRRLRRAGDGRRRQRLPRRGGVQGPDPRARRLRPQVRLLEGGAGLVGRHRLGGGGGAGLDRLSGRRR
jgi:hypothetical protein